MVTRLLTLPPGGEFGAVWQFHTDSASRWRSRLEGFGELVKTWGGHTNIHTSMHILLYPAAPSANRSML